MAKLNLEYQIKVNDREYIRKFKKAQRLTEDFNDAIRELLEDIKIGIRVVPIKKKWYQFWK